MNLYIRCQFYNYFMSGVNFICQRTPGLRRRCYWKTASRNTGNLLLKMTFGWLRKMTFCCLKWPQMIIWSQETLTAGVRLVATVLQSAIFSFPMPWLFIRSKVVIGPGKKYQYNMKIYIMSRQQPLKYRCSRCKRERYRMEMDEVDSLRHFSKNIKNIMIFFKKHKKIILFFIMIFFKKYL